MCPLNEFDSAAEALRERAEVAPDRTLLIFESSRFTYAEVFERACRFGNLLTTRDATRAAVLADNGPEVVAAFFGCSLAGAVFVGLDPTRSGSELAADLASTGADLLIVEPKYAPLLDDDTMDTYVRAERLLVIDAEAPAGLIEPSESLEAALLVSSTDDPDIAPEPGDLAMIQISGGEMSRAIRWTNRRLLQSVHLAAGHLHAEAEKTGWSAHRTTTALGAAHGILLAACRGGSIVLARKFSAEGLRRDTAFDDCVWASMSATQAAGLNEHGCGTLLAAHINGVGTEPIGDGVIEVLWTDESDTGLHRTAGQSDWNSGAWARITDAGRICLAGESVFDGYEDDEIGTQKRMRAGHFDTGLQARMQSGGGIVLATR